MEIRISSPHIQNFVVLHGFDGCQEGRVASCSKLRALLLYCSFSRDSQAPRFQSGNVFFGYSYESTDTSAFGPNVITSTVTRPNLNGWEASFEGKMLPWIGIVADVAGHYGSQNFTEATPNGLITMNVTGHEQEYLFGPRLSVPVGKVHALCRGHCRRQRTSTLVALCRLPRIHRSHTPSAEGLTIGSFVRSLCASKATICERRSSARSKQLPSGRRCCLPLLGRPNVTQEKAGFSWLAESCFLWPRQNS